MAKSIWKDYFTFSKRERISVYILLVILAISIAGPYYYAKSFKQPVVDAGLQKQLIGLLQSNEQDSGAAGSTQNISQSSNAAGITLFNFDPNQLDAAGFKQLGLRDKTIQTILNYRNKGGYFKQPEDIRKIYGLHEDEASRLMPYIKIEHARAIAGRQYTATEEIKTKPAYKKIDINTASEEEWKALPGIGDVLSRRIVKFRSSMHGFTSVQDISRTYGLSDSTFQNILPYLTMQEPAAP